MLLHEVQCDGPILLFELDLVPFLSFEVVLPEFLKYILCLSLDPNLLVDVLPLHPLELMLMLEALASVLVLAYR